jgi:glycosyltransferase involved in cell wall biosynthesis
MVIYPPVTLSTETFRAEGDGEKRHHFLVVARLTQSKQVMAVVEAFNKLGLPLVVVGAGPEEKHLRDRAKANITFTGFLDDQALVREYAQARALIFPSEEDFGMVAVEALSSGTPVIALDYGGIREILTDPRMGETFHSSNPEIIAEGVRRFLEKEGTYDEALMKESVKKFRREQFQSQMKMVIAKL